jgi:hypothetical protein
MKVYVVCTPEISVQRVSDIKRHFEPMNRPIEFVFVRLGKVDFGGMEKVDFEDLFEIAADYRSRNNKVEDSDFVLTLTDVANNRNYFAYLEDGNTRNGFVHATEWERFIQCEIDLPVAFTILNIVLLGLVTSSQKEMEHTVHRETIGCVNDFCWDKRDVKFKLRTADICVNCVNRLVDRSVSTLKIEQSMTLLEKMREQMKDSLHFHRKFQASRMEFDIERNTIVLSDYENAEVKLKPLYMAFYLLMLKLRDGVNIKDLWRHEAELSKLYILTSGKHPEYHMQELNSSVKRAVRPVKGSSSEMISRINSTFESAVGPNFSKPYIIDGPNGGNKGVSIDREAYVVGWLDFMG